MATQDSATTFLFTFSNNGEAHGLPLVEVQVKQLADNDVSVAADAFRRTWNGTEEALVPVLESLGFSELDIRGLTAALNSHSDADRKLAVTYEQLAQAGFAETEL